MITKSDCDPVQEVKILKCLKNNIAHRLSPIAYRTTLHHHVLFRGKEHPQPLILRFRTGGIDKLDVEADAIVVKKESLFSRILDGEIAGGKVGFRTILLPEGFADHARVLMADGIEPVFGEPGDILMQEEMDPDGNLVDAFVVSEHAGWDGTNSFLVFAFGRSHRFQDLLFGCPEGQLIEGDGLVC